MSSEICLKFPDLETMLSKFVEAGLEDGCDGKTWVSVNTSHAYYLIDDEGSGSRWDEFSVQRDGSWCCGYLIDHPLPALLEPYLHSDDGDCCGMATRNG